MSTTAISFSGGAADTRHARALKIIDIEPTIKLSKRNLFIVNLLGRVAAAAF
jgi:hypothetical protein